ncbi:hypothetical protein L2E82_29599 [Cichorium intybus]|uniref:Uncharacterized protein n=1 Tax=Cichorium intybus TaxID=13427 RepID=A0ACB9CY18_CICIN|nr:hypothetical protein L2E82_29599 [Cichorium intybus]
MLTYAEEDEPLDQFNELKEHRTNSFIGSDMSGCKANKHFPLLSRRPFSFPLTSSGLRRWFIIYPRRFRSRGRSVSR